ncbi:MAG: hypothetical protein QOD86_3017, partial [Miltoncostaeaceae bacterium]|nr:hypothetical protein [Miltoncostaeaceae bacterium]
MRRRSAGQAAVELLAAVPIVLAAGFVAWILVAVLWSGMRAEEDVRRQALEARPGAGWVTVTARAPLPALTPPLAGLEVR